MKNRNPQISQITQSRKEEGAPVAGTAYQADPSQSCLLRLRNLHNLRKDSSQENQ
jgi:hypothetical protein